MPYNPQIQDQRALLTLRGLEMGQQRDAMLMHGLMTWLGQRQQDQVMRETVKGMAQDPGAMPPIQDPAAAGMITQTQPVPPNYLQGDITGAPAGGPGGATPGPAEVGPSPGIEEWARKADQAKAMRALIRVYNPEAKDVTKAVDAMGHAQLEGMFKVWGQRQADEARQVQMAEHVARTRLLGSQVAEQEQAMRSDAAVAPALQAWATATGTGGAKATPQERWAAAASTPGFGGAVVPKFIAALANYQKATEADPELTTTFEEDPVTHFRFAARGKSFMPSGVVPGMQKPTVDMQHDADGKLIGWSITDARGHSTFHASKGGPELEQATDKKTGKPLVGFYMDASGKLHDTRGALAKMGYQQAEGAQPGAAPEAKPGAAPAMQTLKSLDKKDYDALKPGVFEWDGKLYEKPANPGGG